MKIAIIALITLTSFFEGNGQTKQINIGETCPDVSMNLTNFSAPTARISDFRNKLLILDFWATWCGPCISALPKNDSLQKLFGDRIQILPVGYQDKKSIAFFLEKMENIRHIKVPSTFDDSELNTYFPHTEIPHCVWIGGDGKVVAITGAEEVNAKNIELALNKSTLSLPKHGMTKRIDVEGTLFYPMNRVTDLYLNPIDSETVSTNDVFYKSIITGYRPGYPSVESFDSNRLTACNFSVEGLYVLAFWNKMNTPNNGMLSFYEPGRVVWKVTDSSILNLSNKSNEEVVAKNEVLAKEWIKRYRFCYELQVPGDWSTDRKHATMLRDLNDFFGSLYGIRASWETEHKKCLALVRTSKIDKLKTKGGETDMQMNPYFFSLRNNSIGTFTQFLPTKFMRLAGIPMVDKTGYDGLVDLELNCDLTKLEEVNKALAKYDLRFVEMDVDVNVIALRQVGKNNAVFPPLAKDVEIK